jgi:hypothetical protein
MTADDDPAGTPDDKTESSASELDKDK